MSEASARVRSEDTAPILDDADIEFECTDDTTAELSKDHVFAVLTLQLAEFVLTEDEIIKCIIRCLEIANNRFDYLVRIRAAIGQRYGGVIPSTPVTLSFNERDVPVEFTI